MGHYGESVASSDSVMMSAAACCRGSRGPDAGDAEEEGCGQSLERGPRAIQWSWAEMVLFSGSAKGATAPKVM